MTTKGSEDGVPWIWTNNLTINLVRNSSDEQPDNNFITFSKRVTDLSPGSRGLNNNNNLHPNKKPNLFPGVNEKTHVHESQKNDKILVPVQPHYIHSFNVAHPDGNPFYGSFTIVTRRGTIFSSGSTIECKPSKVEHTEPQFLKWLHTEVARVDTATLKEGYALIIEINQNNTPCSGKECRKAILNIVRSGKVATKDWDITVARMSAANIYQSQPPAICPTSAEIELGYKIPAQVEVCESMCIHKYPPPKGIVPKSRSRRGSADLTESYSSESEQY